MAPSSIPAGAGERGDLSVAPKLTFFGRLKVTRVIPGTCFKPSFAIDLRAFFSLREWTWIPEPDGSSVSPASPASPASTSETELLEASSTSVALLAGVSSGSSSIRGFDISAISPWLWMALL